MNKTNNRFTFSIIICFFACVLLMVGFFTYGELTLPREITYDQFHTYKLDTIWYRIMPDGTRQEVTIPQNFDVEPGEPLVLETTIHPGIKIGDCLCFKSNRQDMYFYIDGDLVQEYTNVNSRLFGSNTQVAYIFLDIKAAYLSRTLRVECSTTTVYGGMFSAVYYGNKAGLWNYLIRHNIAEIIISLVMLFVGLGCAVVSIFHYRTYKEMSSLGYIGWLAILAAIWIFTNSNLRQLVFPNLSTAGDIPFMAIMLVPIPIALYLNSIQSGRYQRLELALCIAALADFVICTSLHFMNIVPFSSSVFFMQVMLVVAFLTTMITVIKDCITGDIRSYIRSAVGILLGFLAGLTHIVMYLARAANNGQLVCVAIIIIMIATAIDGLHDSRKREWERREAILSSKSKAQFLASMSHEIRTPINAVLGMDEMILRESTEANVREYAMDLQRAGQTLLALINDILDFSKIESNKLDIIEVDYEISSLINDSYNMVAERAKEKDLTLKIECDDNLPRRLHGDEVRVRQIIINFLTNAIKYTPTGTVTLRVSGQLIDDGNYMLNVSVSDTGIGIKSEDLEKLFSPFNRFDEQRNRHIEGTGLGLSISRQLVEMMNGHIYVESEYQKGSTFSFEIPQQILGDDVLNDMHVHYFSRASSNEIYRESFVAPNARILVVDDVDMNLKVFKGLLKATKIQIETASNGEDCINLVASRKYDMVFLDHMMPHMDGLETFEHIKKLAVNPNKNTPIVMLTANAISGAKEEYLRLGFVDYLSKPIQQAALEQLLLTYLPKDLVTENKPKEYEDVHVTSLINKLNQFLDADAGLEYYSGSIDFYREILVAYVEDGDVEKMDIPLNAGDLSNYQVLAHSLKSSSTYIGAKQLAEEARKLEYAANNHDTEYIHEHHSSVMNMYRDVLNHLRDVLEM